MTCHISLDNNCQLSAWGWDNLLMSRSIQLLIVIVENKEIQIIDVDVEV